MAMLKIVLGLACLCCMGNGDRRQQAESDAQEQRQLQAIDLIEGTQSVAEVSEDSSRVNAHDKVTPLSKLAVLLTCLGGAAAFSPVPGSVSPAKSSNRNAGPMVPNKWKQQRLPWWQPRSPITAISMTGFKKKPRISFSSSGREIRPLLEPSDYPFELAVRKGLQYDPAYPGTAVYRLSSVLKRVKDLPSLDGPWADVRRHLLAAGGLKEDHSTSHAFNDDNHCDLTTMDQAVTFNDNSDGAVAMISRGNLLGPHIVEASLPELGPGGSWSTCTNGAHLTPPSDVAHVQFYARVAFKLVWVPPGFTQFVLVDDEGRLLRHGTPTGNLPDIRSRQGNYALVQGGKYAKIADIITSGFF